MKTFSTPVQTAFINQNDNGYHLQIPTDFYKCAQTLQIKDAKSQTLVATIIYQNSNVVFKGTGRFSIQLNAPPLEHLDVHIQGDCELYGKLEAQTQHYGVSGQLKNHGQIQCHRHLISSSDVCINLGFMHIQNAYIHNFSNHGTCRIEKDFGNLETWKACQQAISQLNEVTFATSAEEAWNCYLKYDESTLDADQQRIGSFISTMLSSWLDQPEFFIKSNTGQCIIGGNLILPKSSLPIENDGHLEILSGGQYLKFTGLGSLIIGSTDSLTSPKTINIDLYGSMQQVVLHTQKYTHLRLINMSHYNGDIFATADIGMSIYVDEQTSFTFSGLLICNQKFSLLQTEGAKKAFVLQSPTNQVEMLPDVDSDQSSSPFKKGDIVANHINIASSGLFHHHSGRLLARETVRIGGHGYDGAIYLDGLILGQDSVLCWTHYLSGHGQIATKGQAALYGEQLDLTHLSIQSNRFRASANNNLNLPGHIMQCDGGIELTAPTIQIEYSMLGNFFKMVASDSIRIATDVILDSPNSITMMAQTGTFQGANSMMVAPNIYLRGKTLQLEGQLAAKRLARFEFQKLVGGASNQSLYATEHHLRSYEAKAIAIYNANLLGHSITAKIDDIHLNHTSCQFDQITFDSNNKLQLQSCDIKALHATFTAIRSMELAHNRFAIQSASFQGYQTANCYDNTHIGEYHEFDFNELRMQNCNIETLNAKFKSACSMELIHNRFAIQSAYFEGHQNTNYLNNKHIGEYHVFELQGLRSSEYIHQMIMLLDTMKQVRNPILYAPQTKYQMSDDCYLTHPNTSMTFSSFMNDGATLNSAGNLQIQATIMGSRAANFVAKKMNLSATHCMVHVDGTRFESKTGDIILQTEQGSIYLYPEVRVAPLAITPHKHSVSSVHQYSPVQITSAGNIRIQARNGQLHAPVVYLQSNGSIELDADSIKIIGAAQTYIQSRYKERGFLGFSSKTVQIEGVHFSAPCIDASGDITITAQGEVVLDGSQMTSSGNIAVTAKENLSFAGLTSVVQNHTKNSNAFGGWITEKQTTSVLGKVASVSSPYPILLSSQIGGIHAKGLEVRGSVQYIAPLKEVITGSLDLPTYHATIKRGPLHEASGMIGMFAGFITALYFPPAQGIMSHLISASASFFANTLTTKALAAECSPKALLQSFSSEDLKSLLCQVSAAIFNAAAFSRLNLAKIDNLTMQRLGQHAIQQGFSLHAQGIFYPERLKTVSFHQLSMSIVMASIHDTIATHIGSHAQDNNHNRILAHMVTGAMMHSMNQLIMHHQVSSSDFMRGMSTAWIASYLPEALSTPNNSRDAQLRHALYGKLAAIGMHMLSGGNYDDAVTLITPIIENNFLGEHHDLKLSMEAGDLLLEEEELFFEQLTSIGYINGEFVELNGDPAFTAESDSRLGKVGRFYKKHDVTQSTAYNPLEKTTDVTNFSLTLPDKNKSSDTVSNCPPTIKEQLVACVVGAAAGGTAGAISCSGLIAELPIYGACIGKYVFAGCAGNIARITASQCITSPKSDGHSHCNDNHVDMSQLQTNFGSVNAKHVSLNDDPAFTAESDSWLGKVGRFYKKHGELTHYEIEALRTSFNMVSFAFPAAQTAKTTVSLATHTIIKPSIEMAYNSWSFQTFMPPGYVFRGTPTVPEVAFNRGFLREGSLNLRRHVAGKKNSGYLSTSKSSKVALLPEFGGKSGRYVYALKRVPNGVDVNAALGKHRFSYEKEIAIPGGVESQNILGARKVKAAGKLTGPFIKNSFFQAPTGLESIEAIRKTAKKVLYESKPKVGSYLPLFGVLSQSREQNKDNTANTKTIPRAVLP